MPKRMEFTMTVSRAYTLVCIMFLIFGVIQIKSFQLVSSNYIFLIQVQYLFFIGKSDFHKKVIVIISSNFNYIFFLVISSVIKIKILTCNL